MLNTSLTGINLVFPASTTMNIDPATAKVDLTYLRDLADDDPEFMREMIETFIADTPLLMAALESAWLAGNINNMRMMAHKIKSSTQVMGLTRFSALARQLEENCAKGILTGQETPVSIPEMRAILELAMAELQEIALSL